MEVKEKTAITTLKDDLSKKAQMLVLEEFPKKIIELNNLLQSDMFSVKDLSELHAKLDASWNGQPEDSKPPSKKRKMANDVDAVSDSRSNPIASNPRIVEVIDRVKPEIICIVERCNELKMWVQLMIPKIEDGNNFGVSIQEDVLSEVTKAEVDAGTYLEQISRYYNCRAKMASKVVKYPKLGDYRKGVCEYDEKNYITFRLVLQEIRNIYVVLYDVIIKNFEKLIRPRNSNTSSLY